MLALETFKIPALLKLPINIQIFTSTIYHTIHQYPNKIGLASSYTITLLLITTISIYFQSHLSSQNSKYSTVTDKDYQPRALDLNK